MPPKSGIGADNTTLSELDRLVQTLTDIGPGHINKECPFCSGLTDPKEIRLVSTNYTKEMISEKTGRIHSRMLEESHGIKEPNFTCIYPYDLDMMFTMYDEYFFDDYFKEQHPGLVRFRLSSRMTSAGAKTQEYMNPRMFVITLSSHLLFQTFDGEERTISVNGITCNDRLEAAQRLFEHEIIHLLEHILYDESSCRKYRFRGLAHTIFGHTDVTHRLVTGHEIARDKHALRVGDKVSFEFEGDVHQGVISRITKRATVMVQNPDGGFEDWSGNKFSKYYIPLERLEPLE